MKLVNQVINITEKLHIQVIELYQCSIRATYRITYAFQSFIFSILADCRLVRFKSNDLIIY